ncbi:MAG: fumarate reductase cytochrome b subunit [Halieaceae bacterium]
MLPDQSTPARFDPWPARLEMLQGASGLALVLFMWVHMFMVSSILLGEDAMYWVARGFEGEYFFGRPYPLLVSAIAAVVFFIFLAHALVAMWKLPASYREYRVFWRHTRSLRHSDSSLWLVQVVSGLVLMFLASIHLYEMLMHPDQIGPYASADRVVSGQMWLLDLLLIFAAEVHAGVGLYRLIMKWDLLGLTRSARRRRNTRLTIAAIVGFYLVLGLLTFAAYVKIGLEHRDSAGERYVPSWERSAIEAGGGAG